MLDTQRTVPAARIVMNVAYSPRFSTMSRTSSLRALPRSRRAIRASRLRRASRSNALSWKKPKAGIEPSRSSQPRWWMKYWRFGREPVML